MKESSHVWSASRRRTGSEWSHSLRTRHPGAHLRTCPRRRGSAAVRDPDVHRRRQSRADRRRLQHLGRPRERVARHRRHRRHTRVVRVGSGLRRRLPLPRVGRGFPTHPAGHSAGLDLHRVVHPRRGGFARRTPRHDALAQHRPFPACLSQGERGSRRAVRRRRPHPDLGRGGVGSRPLPAYRQAGPRHGSGEHRREALRRTAVGATVAKLSTSDAPWPTSLRNRLPTLGTGPSNISTTRSPWRTWRRAPT